PSRRPLRSGWSRSSAMRSSRRGSPQTTKKTGAVPIHGIAESAPPARRVFLHQRHGRSRPAGNPISTRPTALPRADRGGSTYTGDRRILPNERSHSSVCRQPEHDPPIRAAVRGERGGTPSWTRAIGIRRAALRLAKPYVDLSTLAQ